MNHTEAHAIMLNIERILIYATLATLIAVEAWIFVTLTTANNYIILLEARVTDARIDVRELRQDLKGHRDYTESRVRGNVNE